jgi:DNA-binding GntR family transcriptional regulator
VTKEAVVRPGVDVQEELRLRVVDGRIRPGERIVEERLAEELGVSRTPIREALLALQAEGQVRRTRKGWELVEYTLEEIDDAFQTRAELEAFAAYQAATRGNDKDLAAVRRAHVQMERAVATRGGDAFRFAQTMARCNNDFHSAVVSASHNARLPQLIRLVLVRPLVFSAFAWYTEDEVRESSADHGRIHHAISDRDARRAERLMAEHVLSGRDVVLEHLRQVGDAGPNAWHRFDQEPSARRDPHSRVPS